MDLSNVLAATTKSRRAITAGLAGIVLSVGAIAMSQTSASAAHAKKPASPHVAKKKPVATPPKPSTPAAKKPVPAPPKKHKPAPPPPPVVKKPVPALPQKTAPPPVAPSPVPAPPKMPTTPSRTITPQLPTPPTSPGTPDQPVMTGYLVRTWRLQGPCTGTYYRRIDTQTANPDTWNSRPQFTRLEEHGNFETLVYKQDGVTRAGIFLACTNGANYRREAAPLTYAKREIRQEWYCDGMSCRYIGLYPQPWMAGIGRPRR